MPYFAFDLFKHFPAPFIAMKELCRHLSLVEHRHQRLKHPLEALQPISDRAWGQMDTLMLQLLTSTVGGAAIEVFVQQYPRPHRHPERAFGDQPWGGWGCDEAWPLWALTPLLIALALDATHMGLNLNFDDVGRFGAGKGQEGFTTGRAVLGLFA